MSLTLTSYICLALSIIFNVLSIVSQLAGPLLRVERGDERLRDDRRKQGRQLEPGAGDQHRAPSDVRPPQLRRSVLLYYCQVDSMITISFFQ